jgi:hypothetical protein
MVPVRFWIALPVEFIVNIEAIIIHILSPPCTGWGKLSHPSPVANIHVRLLGMVIVMVQLLPLGLANTSTTPPLAAIPIFTGAS